MLALKFCDSPNLDSYEFVQMDFSTCITSLLKKSFSKCFLKWSFITIGNTGYLTFLKSNSDCLFRVPICSNVSCFVSYDREVMDLFCAF